VVWKPDSPNFIPMECLVYIIREGGRGHEEQTMSVLLPLLLARCEAILKKKILWTIDSGCVGRADYRVQDPKVSSRVEVKKKEAVCEKRQEPHFTGFAGGVRKFAVPLMACFSIVCPVGTKIR
jgi:hypothetical protein